MIHKLYKLPRGRTLVDGGLKLAGYVVLKAQPPNSYFTDQSCTCSYSVISSIVGKRKRVIERTAGWVRLKVSNDFTYWVPTAWLVNNGERL